MAQTLFQLGAAFVPFPYNIPVAVAGQLLFKPEPTKGPRLEEAPTNAATNGSPLPILVGTAKLPGIATDQGELREESDTQSQGKGSLFGGPKVKTFTYHQTILYKLCDTAGDHPIDGVVRVWLNGQLEIDLRPENDGPVTNGHSYRVLFGDENQLPDDELVAEHGEGNVSTGRGTAGIIFYDLDLTPYSASRPVLQAEVVSNGTSSFPKTALDDGGADNWLRCYAPDLYRPYVYAGAATQSTGGERLAKYDKYTGARLALANVSAGYEHTSGTGVQDVIVLANGDPVLVGRLATPVEAVAIRLDADSLTQIGSVSSGNNQVSRRALAVQQTPPLFGAAPAGWYGVLFEGRQSPAVGKVTYILFPATGAPVDLGGATLDNEARGAVDLAGKVWIPSQGTLRGYLFTVTDSGLQPVEAASYDYSGDIGSCLGITYWPQLNALALLGSNGKIVVYDIDEGEVIDEFQTSVASGLEANDADWQNWRTTPWVSYRFANRSGGYALNLLTGEEIAFSNADYGLSTGDEADWENVWFEPETEILWTAREINTGEDSYRLKRPRLAGQAVTVGAALDRISELCFDSASDYDFSGQTDSLYGFAVREQMRAHEAMEPLLTAYFCDVVEVDFAVKGINRGGAVARALTVDDLGAASGGGEHPDILGYEDVDPAALPRRVEVQFNHAGRDFEAGLVPAEISSDEAGNDESRVYQWPIVFDDEADVKSRALRMLLAARANAQQFQLDTLTYHAALAPADVVTAADLGGNSHRLRVDRMERGMNGVIKLEGAREQAEVYSLSLSDAVDQSAVYTPPGLQYRPAVRLLLLDIPLLRPQDDNAIGPYAAVVRRTGAGSFGGAAIQKAVDGGESWVEIGTITGEAAGGFAATALGDTDRPYVWDDVNTLDVTVENGLDLENKTDAQLLGDWANLMALIPKADSDRAELLQFGAATQLSGNTWRLSHLLRGRLGTEPNTGLHAAGDLWVLITDSNVAPLSQPLAEIDTETVWRAIANGQTVKAFEEVAFTNTGKRLWCYAPYDLAATADTPSAGDVTVTFKARSRTTPAPFLNHPVGEDSELYAMAILDAGGNELREITGSSKSLVYTAAQQSSDGGAGVTAKVHQINATLAGIAGQTGRGYGTEVALP